MPDDRRTASIPSPAEEVPARAGAVLVTHLSPDGERRTRRFTDSFLIGSHTEADLRIPVEGISRRHAEVYRQGDDWRVRDLESTNGTSLNGSKVRDAPLTPSSVLRLIPGGAPLYLELEGTERLPAEGGETGEIAGSVTGIYKRYFDSSAPEEAQLSERTMRFRQAYQRARKRHAKRYWVAIAALAVVLSLLGLFAVLQQRRLSRVTNLAVDIFYQMRELELDLAKLQGSAGRRDELALVDERLRSMEERYDRLLDELGLFDEEVPEADRLILRMARVFGECELNMPEQFSAEVKRYIDDWTRSDRLARAMRKASSEDLAPLASTQMLDHHLPPQFLYVSLQESDFDLQAIGRRTRFGIAKGPWQFIPDTALQFGLSLGPLVELREYDPADERFDFEKASAAAARYLRYLYTTEAQASGLLVLASYNWGHNNVRRRIRSMPENPRERNFWQLLQHHELPKETYDYVFKIFSAAVICENPELFGFDFENPFADL